MSVIGSKWDLRRAVRRTGRELSPAYMAASGERICTLLLSMGAWRAAGTVGCFVGTEREIDTRPILEAALSEGRRLCVPLCTGPGRMEMRFVSDLGQLVPGTMGILEPPSDAPTADPDEIDLLAVPCVTCDHRGRRLGHGGGYYDRYLAGYQGLAVLLCREALIREDVPMEPHDRTIPWVLTERGLFEDGSPAPLG